MLGFYVLATVAIFIFFTAQDAPFTSKFDTLRTHGFLTTGTITSFAPHNGVCYSYVVEGSSYQACSGDHYPGEDQARQHVGSQLPVVYDDGNPAISCSCDPESEYESRTAPGQLLVAMAFAALVTFGAFAAFREWLRRTSIEAGGPSETEPRQPL